MTARGDEELVSLSKRITSLELLARERIALADAYMKKVEELNLEVKQIDDRIHAAEKSIGIIQARMALLTAFAAVVGSLLGQLIVHVANSFLGG